MKRLSTIRPPSGFTLVELLVVITIIALLGTMSVVVSRLAVESARRTRTQMTIAKIDSVVILMYEKYQYKQVDLKPYLTKSPQLGNATDVGNWWIYTVPGTYATSNTLWGQYIATYNAMPTATRANLEAKYRFNQMFVPQLMRLHLLRDTIRMEMPCWAGDVYMPAGATSSAVLPNGLPDGNRLGSALVQVYRQALGVAVSNYGSTFAWTPDQHAEFNAELLYLIVMNGDPESRSLFNDKEIADVNGNGLFEFIDGWGRPIHWLRWCPGLGSVDRPFIGNGTSAADGGIVDLLGVTDLLTWRTNWGINTDTDRQFWGNDPNTKFDDDPFDPVGIDNDVACLNGLGLLTNSCFLVPYIFSSGPDGEAGIDPGRFGYISDSDRQQYALQTLYPFQYAADSPPMRCGGIEFSDPTDSTTATTGRLDNIHNHSVKR